MTAWGGWRFQIRECLHTGLSRHAAGRSPPIPFSAIFTLAAVIIGDIIDAAAAGQYFDCHGLSRRYFSSAAMMDAFMPPLLIVYIS